MSVYSVGSKPVVRDRETDTMVEERIEHERVSHSAPAVPEFPNTWARIRDVIREPAAEFLGTLFLVMFGLASNCQATLFSNPNVQEVVGGPKGDWASLTLGWGAGIALGAWVAGGISGGHINPAVTLMFAVFRGFPWRKVPIYWLAQILGAWIGALLVYANYFHAIDLFEGGSGVRTLSTAGLFGTYPLPYMTNVSAFFDEFIGTALLIIVILAATDKRNGPPPSGLLPLVLFITFCGITAAFGAQTGFAINPARDLGPRIATWMVGYGRQVFNFRNQYWVWCPIMASFLGALSGAFVYDTLLFTGSESLINKATRHARALSTTKTHDSMSQSHRQGSSNV